ncbi:sensor histidine kinase [Desulfovibrio ferrophilus]|uniref:histidine kinase n=1 Tax=Desulfovibrio ferrophilus TaxID=241368 RepID=A0A2Z6AVG9_9BACT|nr:histidine kinase dimerization/phosphoacceptor domain -containing protein [Desulfovibrio ferrophilus]BBD07242.1 signal transduction histidine kinase [Desulfovibrio ferrophilus]
MTDILLEILRSILMFLICITLATANKQRAEITRPNWKLLMAGMWLVFLGTLFDITDNYPQLNRWVLIGDTPAQAFMEKVVCYLGGLSLIAWGAIKWLPLLTELEQNEANLAQLEKRYRTVTTMTSDFAFTATVHPNDLLKLSWLEGPFEDIVGYSLDEIPTSEQWHLFLHPEDLPRVKDHARHVIRGNPVEFECRIITKTGQLRHLHYVAKPVRCSSTNDVIEVVGAASDITLRKLAEENMTKALDEKHILLQELHHRVKNNLQVVNSLVDIAARNVTGNQTREAFRDIQAKLRSMSLVHSQLYTSRDMGNVRFDDYAKSLCNELQSMFNAHEIQFTYLLDEIKLPIGTAIPLGLVLNEAVTNALKHAPSGDISGAITIQLEQTQGNGLTLRVTDNGPGFPSEIDPAYNNEIGLKLMNNLVTYQLHGHLQLSNGQGACVEARVPLSL